MSASLSDVVGATLVVFVSAWTWQKWRQRRNHGRALPPGPNGLPVLGNALDLPGQDQWEKARQWGEKYGGSKAELASEYSSSAHLFLR